jgi:hypothetical protein
VVRVATCVWERHLTTFLDSTPPSTQATVADGFLLGRLPKGTAMLTDVPDAGGQRCCCANTLFALLFGDRTNTNLERTPRAAHLPAARQGRALDS